MSCSLNYVQLSYHLTMSSQLRIRRKDPIPSLKQWSMTLQLEENINVTPLGTNGRDATGSRTAVPTSTPGVLMLLLKLTDLDQIFKDLYLEGLHYSIGLIDMKLLALERTLQRKLG